MRRTLAVFAMVSLTLVALALPASAHVTVNPRSATSGSFATLTFQVPNEKDAATTTKVEVQFPRDNPIAQASVKPVPGWTAKVTKKALTTPVTTDDGDSIKDSVDTITWTADDGIGVKVGEFQQFLVSVHLPEASSVTFPAIQTYSDGTIVNWIDVAVAGGPEAEHPAPVVKLVPAAEEDAATPVAAATTSADDSDSAQTIAIIALIVGAAGLLVAIGAFVSRKKSGSASA